MTSTATQKPMSASELICAIHLLSKSHLCTLEAVRYSPDTEQDAVAEKLIDELLAFIDKSRPKVVPKFASPFAEKNYQLLLGIAKSAELSALFMADHPEMEGCCKQFLRSEQHDALASAVNAMQNEGLLRLEVVNSHVHVGNAKERDYKTPYGHKFSCLSKLALQLADIVEDKEGRTFDLTLSTEHRSICMLIDMLVDAGVLPLNSVKKVDGISISQLQQIFGSAITVNSPAITVSAPAITITGRLHSPGY
ncbi:hypothetical protein KDM71_004225 [Salmonella enterica]|nr:hypothetical protein [Salmonella enterica subsp. diarizonae]EDW9522830.1 hypothetical protein [Salmonella enterica subsp. diarizonae]EHL3623857.1 hypothetical protein [Salmonella enterica]